MSRKKKSRKPRGDYHGTRVLIASLPIDAQTRLLEWLTARLHPTNLYRAQNATQRVSALFAECSTWSVPAILARVSDGTGPSNKRVYNALGYLTRRRVLRRTGYGCYHRVS